MLSTFDSKESFWPSLSEPMPARSTALIWTKTSLPPSSGCMKPKPLVALNHLTVHLAIVCILVGESVGFVGAPLANGALPKSPLQRSEGARRLRPSEDIGE